MKNKLLLITISLLVFVCSGQECPSLISPANNDMNVPVNTTISWNAVTGVPGYLISIGTSPGATDIQNNLAVGSATSYTPQLGLPENETIYVTITLFFFDPNIDNIVCAEEMFQTEDVLTAPSCAVITSPINGSTNVNIGTPILWEYAPTATAYNISIGTSLGGEEIVADTNIGNVLSYNPPADLPQNTTVFVQVTPSNDNGSTSETCNSFSFTTGSAATIPVCTNLITPINGAINVPLTPLLEWEAVSNATGYRVTIGSSPFTAEVLDNVSFFTNSTLVLNFEPNRTFFMTIVPFNDAGEAIGCGQETFSTLLGCGPYFDSDTGELINLAPVIDFPDSVGICLNDTPLVARSNDSAEGFRWYKIVGNTEELLGTTDSVELSEEGLYRYEAYNTASQDAQIIECVSTKEFIVVASEAPEIRTLNVTSSGDGINIEVQLQNEGDFEYALNSSDGPYQDSSIFTNLEAGSYTVFVQDKNGCGQDSETYLQQASAEGFPKFFTPNGDLVNDYWQFIESTNAAEPLVRRIQIYDRYGSLVAEIAPDSVGWDGKFNGQPLPETDYWFRAISSEGRELKGHFSLKR